MWVLKCDKCGYIGDDFSGKWCNRCQSSLDTHPVEVIDNPKLQNSAIEAAQHLRTTGYSEHARSVCAALDALDAQAATIAARDEEVKFLRERLERTTEHFHNCTEKRGEAAQACFDKDKEIEALRERLEAQDVEIARLQNAAKSRLKCPQGHSPGESRGACWFCDAERNAERLERVRVALATAEAKHAGDCTVHVTSLRREYGCDCGADALNAALAAARKEVG